MRIIELIEEKTSSGPMLLIKTVVGFWLFKRYRTAYLVAGEFIRWLDNNELVKDSSIAFKVYEEINKNPNKIDTDLMFTLICNTLTNNK